MHFRAITCLPDRSGRKHPGLSTSPWAFFFSDRQPDIYRYAVGNSGRMGTELRLQEMWRIVIIIATARLCLLDTVRRKSDSPPDMRSTNRGEDSAAAADGAVLNDRDRLAIRGVLILLQEPFACKPPV